MKNWIKISAPTNVKQTKEVKAWIKKINKLINTKEMQDKILGNFKKEVLK